ncbi:MAG: nucleoside hydrolase, partial [Dehalococcoidia bacterium]
AHEEMATSSAVAPRFVVECSRKYMDFHREEEGFDGAYLHDPLAVGVVVDPSLVRTESVRIYVETREGLTRGMTVPFRRVGRVEEPPNCRTTTAVDSERFLRLFLERIKA